MNTAAAKRAPSRIDPEAWRQHGRDTYEGVMCEPIGDASSPYIEAGLLDFVFADIWNRRGLNRRNRRWVTLSCVCASDAAGPIEAHVYAALKSGDMTFDEMQEFVLHFAVYCGWPKASFVDEVVVRQQTRINEQRGEGPPELKRLEVWNSGMDPEIRMQNGEESFSTINCVPAVPRTSPYRTAGILNFVFGEVWQRPGLTIRDRRFITVACVGLDDTIGPIRSHVFSALKSKDVTYEEMQELVLQFAAYSGWPKASFLDQVADESWTAIQQQVGTQGD